MKFTPLAKTAALVVAAILAFVAGRLSSDKQAAGTDAEGPPATRSSARAAQAAADDAARSSTARGERTPRSGSVAASDRMSRLETIVRGENPLDRSRALLAFIDQLGPADFEGAVDHFRNLGITESRLGEYAMLLSAWAKTDPLAALAYARNNTGGRFATDTILATWATIDPEAAIRWANANHSGDGANQYLVGIIRGLAASDTARASELLTSMPRSQERGQALDAILPVILAQGNAATREWIAAINDDSLRNGAMLRTAERLAANDPAGTVQWLLDNPGEATNRRMDNVFSVWARKDKEAAVASLGTVPAGEARSDALRGVISSVAVDDPAAAVSLMDRYSADVDTRVVRNFIWHALDADPAVAVSQIARIGQAGDQEWMYRRAVGRWLEKDASAASAWIRDNPLPPSVIKDFQRRNLLP